MMMIHYCQCQWQLFYHSGLNLLLFLSLQSLYLLYIWEKWNIDFKLPPRVFMTHEHPFEYKKHLKKLPCTKLNENTTFMNRYLSKVSVKSIWKKSSLFPRVTGHFSFSLIVVHFAPCLTRWLHMWGNLVGALLAFIRQVDKGVLLGHLKFMTKVEHRILGVDYWW